MGIHKVLPGPHESKQVALHVVLKYKDTKIDIVTGHFKSGEKDTDKFVKPYHIAAFNEKLKELKANGNALIVACDFNTNRATPAYEKFEQANLDLESAYNLELLDKEKRYTSSKWRRGGDQPDKCKVVEQTIDFIFTNKKLKATKTLSVPTSSEVSNASELLLPCWRYPSDHFMIGADLVFADD